MGLRGFLLPGMLSVLTISPISPSTSTSSLGSVDEATKVSIDYFSYGPGPNTNEFHGLRKNTTISCGNLRSLEKEIREASLGTSLQLVELNMNSSSKEQEAIQLPSCLHQIPNSYVGLIESAHSQLSHLDLELRISILVDAKTRDGSLTRVSRNHVNEA
ncbi:hypothetical protein ZIOFF_051131 [Zingiber officinale]|uniref:Uncharacterized protein n=1 Tax=Zingiber officinale TaxID=94328 RepID=A0A8J5FJZ3_ZINOF|nr:hypothetical protein ZIOFF_051131 [Zingiber officinale]